MFQKFKITFYTLIVLLVLVLPSQADAVEFYADSCAGWDCSHEGMICPQGAEGASSTSYICRNSEWVPTTCTVAEIIKNLKILHEQTYAGGQPIEPCLLSPGFNDDYPCRDWCAGRGY